METLHEHMLATKTVEYLLGAGFLVVFAAFWVFLNGQRKKS
jgi:hypothetical protein